MRPALWLAAALGLLALACVPVTHATKNPSSSARSGISPAVPAISSPAAGVRTRLDLLLAEQVMIVAKETAAAANHNDEYAGYTTLLTSSTTDLADLIRSAFGDTAADNFTKSWNAQNASLVDYGIGVVTHNDSKASAAMSDLSGQVVQNLTARITDMTGLETDAVGKLFTEQVGYDKAFIDDAGAQEYSSFYSDLQTAYFASERLGDALAARIAQRYPDRFPGDPTVPAVDRRVLLNTLLQQHAYVATMTTDAVAGSRDADKTAAVAALSINQAALSRSIGDQYGRAASADFDKAWSARDAALVAYAQKGDSDSKRTLSETAASVALAARVQAAPVSDELTALMKVVDDQRAKASDRIAGDDRAAATSMQPVGDAILAGEPI